MGLHDLVEFDFVADPGTPIRAENWPSIQSGILELQPAAKSILIGDPPTAIRVVGYCGVEVAPGLLARLSDLAGTTVRVVPSGK